MIKMIQDLPLIGEQVSRKLRMRLPLSWDGKIQWQGERLCSYAAIIMSTRIPWSKSLRTSDTQIGIDRQGSTDHSLSPLLFTTDIELQKPPCLRALSAAQLFGLCQAQVVTSHFFSEKASGVFAAINENTNSSFNQRCAESEKWRHKHTWCQHMSQRIWIAVQCFHRTTPFEVHKIDLHWVLSQPSPASHYHIGQYWSLQ